MTKYGVNNSKYTDERFVETMGLLEKLKKQLDFKLKGKEYIESTFGGFEASNLNKEIKLLTNLIDFYVDDLNLKENNTIDDLLSFYSDYLKKLHNI